MVQVDVFWSYAFGAGFAFAATRQLVAQASGDTCEACGEKRSWYDSTYFISTVLYLAVLFAPSGVCLLWAFPSWETMHAGDRNLPAWLVTLFAVTNVTQGMLGYWVVRKLVLAGKRFYGFLQIILGYFLMFFILVHGWDGTGYKRFFSATKADFLDWKLSNIPLWLVSNVAVTLYLMGLVLIPVLLFILTKWVKQGHRMDDVDKEAAAATSGFDLAKMFLITILGYSLGMAIAASLLIHLLGWIIGFAVFLVAGHFLLLRKGGPLYRMALRILCPKGQLDKQV